MKRIKAEGIEIVVYEPLLDETHFFMALKSPMSLMALSHAAM